MPGEHFQRFPADKKSGSRSWCIEVDKHPLGLQPLSDEGLKEAYTASGLAEFIDPRKGPLFWLIEDYEKVSNS